MNTLSVVIPTRNRAPVLIQALRHLNEGSMKPDEVIIVDDASSEPIGTCLAGMFPDLHLIPIRFETHRGASAARNAGIRTARGNIIVCQDDDIFADHHMVRFHRQIHEQHAEQTYGVMGRIYFDPDLPRNPVMHYLEEYGAFRGISKTADRTRVDSGLISANFSLKRELIRNEKLFDENFPYNRNEDTEFAFRMMEKGWRLHFHIAPSARHHSKLTLDQYFVQLKQGGSSKAYWSDIRPDDSEHCLRLGLVASRKLHEAAFHECFRYCIGVFGTDFLSHDIGASSHHEFEEFRLFMDSIIPWAYALTLADGWLEIIPGFAEILDKVLSAFRASDTGTKLRWLREAYEGNRDFFPVAILWGDMLIEKKNYPEARRVFAPFENLIWGKLKLAWIDCQLKEYENCSKWLQDVFALTKNEKSVEAKQRRMAHDILNRLGRMRGSEKWLDRIRPHLLVDELVAGALRPSETGNETNIQPEAGAVENPMRRYCDKLPEYRLARSKLNDLSRLGQLAPEQFRNA